MREHSVPCRGCFRAKTWRSDGYCDDCSQHQDDIGARMAEFDAWQSEHRDLIDALELG